MLILKANAKINLYLDITGTLENGYHALEMIMQSISLRDEVFLEKSDALTVDCPGVPQQRNSAYRAATLFFEHSGVAGGASIRIQKHIPQEAGLGGGSADAAAALLGLNELYGSPLSEEILAALALKIGADVPFFLKGGCQQCLGVGEVLCPVQNNLCAHYLVLQPKSGVSTPAAYQKYDELGGAHGSLSACKAALAAADLPGFSAASCNSLERAALALCPPVADALGFLRKHAPHAFMTGSGSACVGIFLDAEAANAALEEAKARFPFAVLAENREAGIEKQQ